MSVNQLSQLDRRHAAFNIRAALKEPMTRDTNGHIDSQAIHGHFTDTSHVFGGRHPAVAGLKAAWSDARTSRDAGRAGSPGTEFEFAKRAQGGIDTAIKALTEIVRGRA
ncbi:MAG: hypothetical protein ABI200_02970 [Gaiellales bacterium]